jgi:hypothetical protein
MSARILIVTDDGNLQALLAQRRSAVNAMR